jgi:hypothetical protein
MPQRLKEELESLLPMRCYPVAGGGHRQERISVRVGLGAGVGHVILRALPAPRRMREGRSPEDGVVLEPTRIVETPAQVAREAAEARDNHGVDTGGRGTRSSAAPAAIGAALSGRLGVLAVTRVWLAATILRARARRHMQGHHLVVLIP